MDYDFSKITLLPDELRLLRCGKRKCGIQQSPQNRALISKLYKYGFLELEQDQLWRITREGLRFLHFRTEDRFRHRWPVYLSILAFIISVIALVRSFF